MALLIMPSSVSCVHLLIFNLLVLSPINKRCNFIAPEAFIDFIAVPYKCSSFNADALWDPFFNVTLSKTVYRTHILVLIASFETDQAFYISPLSAYILFLMISTFAVALLTTTPAMYFSMG